MGAGGEGRGHHARLTRSNSVPVRQLSRSAAARINGDRLRATARGVPGCGILLSATTFAAALSANAQRSRVQVEAVRVITFVHAATKSLANFSFASALP